MPSSKSDPPPSTAAEAPGPQGGGGAPPPAGPGPAEFGFFSFTALSGTEHHRGYNEWHQLDHLPEQRPLPGILSGERWVATPACRRRRLVSAAPLDDADYLTLYLMGGPIEATLASFAALAQELRAAGRFFAHRRAILSGPFRVVEAYAAPRINVSAAAVPHRPSRGVYVAVHAAGGPGAPPADELVVRQGVAGAWRFLADPAAADERWRPGDHAVTLCFLDEDPLKVASDLDRAFSRDPGRRTLRLAGPFASIEPWRWDWFEVGGPA